jgi:hypothetical protein
MSTGRRIDDYRQDPRQDYYTSRKHNSHSSRRMAVYGGDIVRYPTETRPRASEQRKVPRTTASYRAQPASRKEPRPQDKVPSRGNSQKSTSNARTTSARHYVELKTEPSKATRPPQVRRISTMTIEHRPEKVVDQHARPAPRNHTDRRPSTPVEKNPRPVRHVHWA